MKTGRYSAILFLLALALLLSAGCSTSKIIYDVRPISDNHFSCTFGSVEHDFIIELPADPEGSPIVLMLPGYGGTAESFRQDTAFHVQANSLGYTVVYVTGSPDPNDKTSATCWNHNADENGNNDVEFLTALASYIHTTYKTDSERCFAVGFSNGAFMCHRLALEASDTFAAVVSVAGSMSENPWRSRPKRNNVGILQMTGEKDDVIPKKSDGSARYSRSSAIEDVIDYYISSNNLGNEISESIGNDSTIIKYSGDHSDVYVWHLLVDDGRHSWSAESITGIDTNALVLEFLNLY